MLGYTEKDIYKMISSISLAKKQLSPYLLTTPEILEGLNNTHNLLEGLLAEGRI